MWYKKINNKFLTKEEDKMEEKEIQDSSKYKKLEDKKYKKGITLKRFILLVFAIVMILILIIGIRWKLL